MKILVLCGGTSEERDVSLRSGAGVAAALNEADHEVGIADPADHLDDDFLRSYDVIFPALHGPGGEDGSLQARLENLDIPFVGSDSQASALCFDKWHYRQVMSKGGIAMPRGDTLQHHEHSEHELAQDLHVLKPITGGSSIDTFIVRDLGTIPYQAIAQTFERHPKMLIEELIDGTELTVGILDKKPLPVIEIIPPVGGNFDYVNKYNGRTKEIVAPEHVSAETQAAAQQLAWQAHQLTGCRDFSRTDIMCDRDGRLLLLETNTLPGMTDQSLFPKAAAAAGITMSELVDQLVRLAAARQGA
ncbi:MAG TPA: D-alanine--D-alanine ligase [Candidatus Saccharimonadales bacterium]|nr:D-alanine--D-alanine ligase [Candidatus Saccharimonadales bacterium]